MRNSLQNCSGKVGGWRGVLLKKHSYLEFVDPFLLYEYILPINFTTLERLFTLFSFSHS